MILSKITLRNFKVYYGEQAISCEIKDLKHPVVLIGGNTGSGKTSIIEAIKLCLYGSQAEQVLTGFKSYQSLLKALHNKKALSKNSKSFAVSVNFLLDRTKELEEVEIERYWVLNNSGNYTEHLEIRLNGDEIEFTEKEYWQDFIEDISPLGLCDFLYFDSEEFRRIPSYLENGFSQALMKFFGISAYQQLDEDLSRHMTYLGSKYDSKLADEVKKNREKISSLNKEISSLGKKANSLEDEILELNNARKKTEKKLTLKAGRFAKNQRQVITQKEEVLNQLRDNQTEYENICGELLPFSLAPSLSKQLINQLTLEEKLKHAKTVQTEFTRLGKKIFKDLNNKLQKNDLLKVKETWKKVRKVELPKGKIIHDVSETENDNIIQYLENALNKTKGRLTKNRSKHQHLNKDFSGLQRTLAEIKPAGPSNAVYLELQEINNDIGTKKEQLQNNSKNLEDLYKSLDYWNSAVDGGERRLIEKGETDNKINLAVKTQKVIRTYKKYLMERRFDSLRSEFLKTLKKLSTKEDLVHGIDFDLEKESLKFINKNGKKLSVVDLSSGESEIVAISLLWAINNVSGIHHPVVTDSPFNRLDSKHRKNFVNKILNGSNQQVIFLSTDQEIQNTSEYGISKTISSCHLIKHNSKQKTSSVEPGYYN